MRRAITTALTLALILGTTEGQGGQAVAEATRPSPLYDSVEQNANRGEWRDARCRFKYLDGRKGWSDWEVRRTIRCAAIRWAVPGGEQGALCIAEHESGLNEWADNRYSSAAGVYQVLASTWESTKAAFANLMRRWRWDLHDSVYNARANVVLAVKKAHAEWSWAAWTVRYLCGL